jgi:hypothetical protein
MNNIHRYTDYTMINIPKTQRYCRDIRKVTQSHIDMHLPKHIGTICVEYLYRPTFQNMTCFETCGILRVPMIGNITSYFTLQRGFHNARCPWFPGQGINCEYHFAINSCMACEGPDIQSSSFTDQPFMIHDRKAMAQFAIDHEPHRNKCILLFGVSFITYLGLNYISKKGGPECPFWICALAGRTIIIALCDAIQNIRIENM